jgi:MFS family permease
MTSTKSHEETIRMSDIAAEGVDHSPTAWFADLSARERKTLGACVGGWALDAMDVQLYSFAIPTLLGVFSMTRADAGLLGTTTLIASAIGGWGAGFLADRIGRVRTLQITILWFAFFTFISGLAQSYEQLFASRALMGFGFGGEWAAGAVLLGETIQPRHRGKALGTMQSGWAIGWAAAAILYYVSYSLLDDRTAWRVLFMIGLAPAILVFFLRRLVDESEVYKESRAKIAATGDTPSFLEIFQPALLRTTLLGALMGTGAQGGYYAITTWLPSFLRTERKLTVLATSGYLWVTIISAFAGYLAGAYLADRIGRRATFLFFAVGSCAIVLIYTMLPISDSLMLILGIPLGFFPAGVFSGMGAFFTEQFPTRVRGAGQGFAYNFGRATGALFPWLVGVLSQSLTLGVAIGAFASVAYGVMAIAAFLLPETKGKELTA